MTGTSVSRGDAAAIAWRNRSRAGVMYGVWNAPDTGRGIAFFAPSSLAISIARATPSGDPAMTIWPGALKLATHTSASARRHATSTSSSSSPRMALIVPGFADPASCIASARSLTRRTPSSNPSAPVAVSAVYSPRLCPAQKLGSTPRRSTASSTIRLDTKVVSWAFRVSFSSSASASSNNRATSRPATSLASVTSSHESWSTHGRPMPGRWDP